MKKIFTLAACLMIVTAGFSQIKTGISAGLNHSRWSGDAMSSLNDLLGFSNGLITTQPVNGIYAGGFVDIPLGSKFSVQPGAYYSQKGFGMQGELSAKNLDFLGARATARIQSHYIDIPVVLKVEPATGLQLYAGPQFSYLVKSNLKTDAQLLGFSLLKSNSDVTDMFNKIDLGLTGGIMYQFNNGFFINAAYDHGLSRLDNHERTKTFNRSFKAGIGFRF